MSPLMCTADKGTYSKVVSTKPGEHYRNHLRNKELCEYQFDLKIALHGCDENEYINCSGENILAVFEQSGAGGAETESLLFSVSL